MSTARPVLDGKTKVVGLFGYPVEHSFSPAMHNAAFAALGLNLCYVAFNVAPAELGAAVAGAKALGFVGFNLTIPHKVAILPFLDELAPEAKFLGAVNTVKIVEGRLWGYNTDGEGFMRALLAAFPELSLAGRKVVILGAGGAAKGVAFRLLQAGVGEIVLANRTLKRAEELVEALLEARREGPLPARKPGGEGSGVSPPPVARALPLEAAAGELAEATLLVNASPVGMHPHEEDPPLLTRASLPPHLYVCDLIYNPPETRLLAEARAAGCRTLNGRGMLLYQGAAAFTLWTGREAPLEVMAAELPA